MLLCVADDDDDYFYGDEMPMPMPRRPRPRRSIAYPGRYTSDFVDSNEAFLVSIFAYTVHTHLFNHNFLGEPVLAIWHLPRLIAPQRGFT